MQLLSRLTFWLCPFGILGKCRGETSLIFGILYEFINLIMPKKMHLLKWSLHALSKFLLLLCDASLLSLTLSPTWWHSRVGWKEGFCTIAILATNFYLSRRVNSWWLSWLMSMNWGSGSAHFMPSTTSSRGQQTADKKSNLACHQSL